ncbi:hypothetical protein ANOM_003646 [Aspergillus nomiae NRRL 13137]|uniref:Transcription factor domain-containing protein n=1 Tax=Aspergillus nomiae NRRL (strain ATCC 15546 / NRRL 13137 / CBS 260.88 / M93) TaxID=1509407 RepID=A0A0L1J883_ASPN3|nr:uncharacterized protein ANOM_003646 [Aspergillus nomiae NRRL 13137]KNG87633.1 hypothetical protein ANOM_003646 [Aspergillus nomiae NRRL 13137]
MGNKPQEFVFVNGPTLASGSNAHSRKIRSALMKRGISEKQTNYRREEAARRERLIDQRKGQGDHQHAFKQLCLCRRKSQGSGSDQTQTIHSSPTFLVTSDGATVCGTCSRPLSLDNLRTNGNQKTKETPSALSAVSGRMDPFSPLDASWGPQVDSLVHFALTSIWPAFRQSNYAGSCYQAWIQQSSQNKLLIYSTLWSASYHRDVLRISYGAPDPALETKEQLYYKGLVLSTLHSHVAEYTDETWRDSVIMSVLYLAVNDLVKGKVARDASPFTPPFVNLQSLSFYGSREYHDMHWTFIQTLLKRLGGIHSIRLFGLGWLLSIADLMFSAHSLTKPQYPLIDVQGNMYNLPSPLHAFRISPERASLPGSGFQELLSLAPPVREKIAYVFVHLGEYSNIIQLFSNHDLATSTLDLIADVRNQVHHDLFSLPNEHDSPDCVIEQPNGPGDNSLSLELYHACRLSALLYALHVTFPVPKSSAPRAMIVPQLTEKLHHVSQNMSSTLLLWCATVAAIAAEGMIQRQTLVQLTDKVRLDLQIYQLTHAVEVLHSFAWVDVACLDGLCRLWDEIVQLG